MIAELISAFMARWKATRHEDRFFGNMKFVRYHWVGQASNPDGNLIEVMLLGGSAGQRDFSKQQQMYEEVRRRYTDIVNEARPLLEALMLEQGHELTDASDYFRSFRLEHVMLPDMGADVTGLRWDLTVGGELPSGVSAASLGQSKFGGAMFVIEMNDWRPIAADLA